MSDDDKIDYEVEMLEPLQGPLQNWELRCGFYRINNGPWKRGQRYADPKLNPARLPL